MREKFPGATISLPERFAAHTNPAPAMQRPARCLADYLEHYASLDEIVDPEFERTVDGGYINQARAAVLADWMDKHPLISALYPYRQLRKALAIAAASWTDNVERGLLQFFATIPDIEALQDLPPDLFGDMYSSIFDTPSAPVSLFNEYLEVTGPCEKGSHNAMIERAVADGALYAKDRLRHGYLFVAKSHIEGRVLSSKITSATYQRMRHGAALSIVAENHYPYEVVGSIRTPAGGHVDGPQREGLRAIRFFLEATQQNASQAAVIADAYHRLYGVKPRDESSAGNLGRLLTTPSRQALSRITTTLTKSEDSTLPAKVLCIAKELVERTGNPSDTAQEALDYMAKRFATSE